MSGMRRQAIWLTSALFHRSPQTIQGRLAMAHGRGDMVHGGRRSHGYWAQPSLQHQAIHARREHKLAFAVGHFPLVDR